MEKNVVINMYLFQILLMLLTLFFIDHDYDESVGIYDLEIPKSSSTSPHGRDKPRDHARTGTRPVKINISEWLHGNSSR